MSGNCLWIWAGAVSGPRDGRASARKTRSGAGDACAGLPLKKSPPARAHDHLHRRKRSKPAAASLPDLVASRRHTRSAVQFQLEDVVGRGRDHLLQLLFPALSRHGEEPAGDRFPRSSAAAISGPLLIVWDRLAAHRSGMVRDFISGRGDRLWVESLPSYAPELNPVEHIWSYWKQHQLPNVCPKNYWELGEAACKTLQRMRTRSRLITAFWQQSELSF